MATDAEHLIRGICQALPGVSERPSHGAPTWFVGRRSFVTLWPNGHHDLDFAHLWCAAPPGMAQAMVAEAADRYFRPPYVGGRGWIGVRLDGATDWEAVDELCRQAWSHVAPVRLRSQSP